MGKTVEVWVLRKGKMREIQVRIGELKEEEQEVQQGEEERPALGMTVQDITPELAGEYRLPEKSGIIVA